MLYAFLFFVLVCLAVVLFLNVHPVFGGNASKEQKQAYTGLNNYMNGKFVNLVPTNMNMSARDLFSMIRDSFSGGTDRKPRGDIPVSPIDWTLINGEEDILTWFGHSAFLLSIDRKKLLVDPMFGPVASPVSFAGSKRFSKDMLSVLDQMPFLDAVLITHDHYDHLDYPSIKKLMHKVGHFFVPLGVGAHLLRWGVAKEKITELNWWDERVFEGLTIAFTPSKHFSGRGVLNRDSTLWGGWVVLGQQTRFYTSGDGGYDAHFLDIGKKYGPFDMTLIEGGQYDRRWSWVHMQPEEAVQAHLDVRGKTMMLIHWGAFSLAFHGWAEPVERAWKQAEATHVPLIAPKIGETVYLHKQRSLSVSPWWKE
ncbi:MBL fold metallo-hydrolase [Brevibacillus fulvus]|uniref:L-ascorbate metabolism protein UlaG (Beta-lactamase superfamily) n=1 Tax=Brevibacillus fulvus TaxID=1125967 RepID=A0A939BSZ8_9BACL|nr:MBL fold metallo-hydrolase [Brevibacillus fulvus]MBM7588994.1 L-ascorbate metabolism protein UlaG (beta-lactamase superfamily) [Brevibacillus fulvus]